MHGAWYDWGGRISAYVRGYMRACVHARMHMQMHAFIRTACMCVQVSLSSSAHAVHMYRMHVCTGEPL